MRVSHGPQVLIELAEVGEYGAGRVDGCNKPGRVMKPIAGECRRQVRTGPSALNMPPGHRSPVRPCRWTHRMDRREVGTSQAKIGRRWLE
jgi:hypothetical protein